MAGITYEQVASAAESLVSAGEKLTHRSIRAKLGNTGSPGTILKFFHQWKDAQVTPKPTSNNNLDPTVTKAINNEILTKVGEATIEATAKIAELLNETNDLIFDNEQQAELLEARAIEFSKLNEDHSALLGRFFQLQSDASSTKTELIAERQGHEAARMELVIALQQLDSLPRLEAELEKFRAELFSSSNQAAADNAAAGITKAKLEAEISHLRFVINNNAEQAARELVIVQDKANKASSEAHKFRIEAAELKGQLGVFRNKKFVVVEKKSVKNGAQV